MDTDRIISRIRVSCLTRIVDTGQAVKYVSVGLKKFGIGLGVALVSLLACSLARAVSVVSLDWNPNPDSSIAGYNVYYGNASRSYTSVTNVGSSTNTMVGGLLEGQTYYFAVTAYTYDGEESDYSDEFVYLVPGMLTLTQATTPASPLIIRFPVEAGHSYQLQQSTDLVNWTTFWQTTGYSNVWVEFNAPITPAPAGFYRVVSH